MRGMLRILGPLMLLASLSSAQDIVVHAVDSPSAVLVETRSGEIPARQEPVRHSPELLVVLAEDVMRPEDYEPARQLIAAVYKATHSTVGIQLAVLHRGDLDIAGPFNTAAELQTVLRKTRPANPPLPPADIPPIRHGPIPPTPLRSSLNWLLLSIPFRPNGATLSSSAPFRQSNSTITPVRG